MTVELKDALPQVHSLDTQVKDCVRREDSAVNSADAASACRAISGFTTFERVATGANSP